MVSNQGIVTDLAAVNQYIQGSGHKYWLSHSANFGSDYLFVVPGPLNVKALSHYSVWAQRMRAYEHFCSCARIR